MKNLSFSTDGPTTSMKERQTPANPKSPKQNANRINFSLSSKGYSALSPANLLLWKAYAKGLTFIGRKTKLPYTPNAFEAYKSLTQVWYGANEGVGTPPSAPPTTVYAPPALLLTADAGSGSIDFTSTAATDANTVVEIAVQPLRNVNRTPSADGYRIATYATFTAPNDDVLVSVGPGAHAARYRCINKLTGEHSAYVEIPVNGISLELRDGGAGESGKSAGRAKKAA